MRVNAGDMHGGIDFGSDINRNAATPPNGVGQDSIRDENAAPGHATQINRYAHYWKSRYATWSGIDDSGESEGKVVPALHRCF